MTLRGAALLLALASMPVPDMAAAQLSVSVSAGENADAATGVSTGASLFMGGSFRFSSGGVTLGAGTPLDGSGLRWGSGSAWLETAGLLGDAQTFAYDDALLGVQGGAVAAGGQLARSLDAGAARVRLRAGGRGGVLFAEGVRPLERLLGRGGVDATVAGATGALRASADVWLAPEAAYPALSVAGAATAHGIRGSGYVEQWLHPDVSGTGWGVGVEVPLVAGLALTAAAARPATDVLFFSPPQRSWSVGLRYGRRPAPTTTVRPPIMADAGAVRIATGPLPGGGAVRVAGTFSGWEPVAMEPTGDGWAVVLSLPPGLYEFAFVAPDGSWFVPEGTPGRKPDGFGGFVATLVVE